METPAHFDELWALFGDHHQERGTLNATGGVQDVTHTLPRTPFVPFGHSSAGASSKRATTDNEVNSPKKAKRSKEVGEYLADISDSMTLGVQSPLRQRRWLRSCKCYVTTVSPKSQSCSLWHVTFSRRGGVANSTRTSMIEKIVSLTSPGPGRMAEMPAANSVPDKQSRV